MSQARILSRVEVTSSSYRNEIFNRTYSFHQVDSGDEPEVIFARARRCRES
jgi:hypothetical protein